MDTFLLSKPREDVKNMQNNVHVQYIEVSKHTMKEGMVEQYFALHIFDNHDEKIVLQCNSLDELKETITPSNIADFLCKEFPEMFFEYVVYANGLYFCDTWYSLEELGLDEEGEKISA